MNQRLFYILIFMFSGSFLNFSGKAFAESNYPENAYLVISEFGEKFIYDKKEDIPDKVVFIELMLVKPGFGLSSDGMAYEEKRHFYISKRHVTNRQYAYSLPGVPTRPSREIRDQFESYNRRFWSSTGYWGQNGFSQSIIEYWSHDDAPMLVSNTDQVFEFCNRLSQRCKINLKVPSFTQWLRFQEALKLPDEDVLNHSGSYVDSSNSDVIQGLSRLFVRNGRQFTIQQQLAGGIIWSFVWPNDAERQAVRDFAKRNQYLLNHINSYSCFISGGSLDVKTSAGQHSSVKTMIYRQGQSQLLTGFYIVLDAQDIGANPVREKGAGPKKKL